MLGLCLIISRAARYLPKLALALNNIPSLCVYYNLYDRRCEMINLWQVYYMVNEPDLCMRHNAGSRWLWRSPSCPAVLQPTLRKKNWFQQCQQEPTRVRKVCQVQSAVLQVPILKWMFSMLSNLIWGNWKFEPQKEKIRCCSFTCAF